MATGKGWTMWATSGRRRAAVALQPDGKIIVAGDRAGFDNTFALLRYIADGSLDPSFGGDGKVTLPLGGTGRAVTLQSGMILVAGSVGTGSGSDFALARYLSDGSLDPAFNGDGNNDGIIVTPIGPGEDVAYAAAVQPDGKIVLAGTHTMGQTLTSPRPATSRMERPTPRSTAMEKRSPRSEQETRRDGRSRSKRTANSSLPVSVRTARTPISRWCGTKLTGRPIFPSASMGRSPHRSLPATTPAHAVSLDGNKVVVAGFAHNGANNDFAVARYTADGSPDALFDGDGKLTHGDRRGRYRRCRQDGGERQDPSLPVSALPARAQISRWCGTIPMARSMRATGPAAGWWSISVRTALISASPLPWIRSAGPWWRAHQTASSARHACSVIRF